MTKELIYKMWAVEFRTPGNKRWFHYETEYSRRSAARRAKSLQQRSDGEDEFRWVEYRPYKASRK